MPPPRGTTATPRLVAARTAFAASSRVAGRAMANGSMPGCQKMSLA